MNNEKMKPTVEWMSRKYDEMNQLLFNGQLGSCKFQVFTSGKGSKGRTLGWFKISGQNLKVQRSDNRIYKLDWYGDKIYVNKSNFVNLCNPVIELNGNYMWTEKAMLTTLVHEMCHYYTYMNGQQPKQGHGAEFKYIASVVSSKSNRFFTIQRLASAERMEELELDSEIAKQNQAREDRKKSKVNAVIVITRGGGVQLTTTSRYDLIQKIVTNAKVSRGNMQIVKKTNNSDIINFLFNQGYRIDMRTWRYWELRDSVVKELNSFGDDKWEILYSADGVTIPNSQPKEKVRKFRLKTNNGEIVMTFENDDDLFGQIKARFPNMRDDVIRKLMDNQNNYIKENVSMRKTNIIIENVIKKYINKKKKELFYW